jgi:hypothetical protein
MDDKLRKILNDVLSSIVKRDYAPCSSETHLNTAVVNLLKLLPEFKAIDERADAVLYAIGEHLLYEMHIA